MTPAQHILARPPKPFEYNPPRTPRLHRLIHMAPPHRASHPLPAAGDASEPGIDSVARTKLLLLWLFAVAASLTTFTHVAQLTHLDFTAYAFIALLLALAVTAVAYFTLRRAFTSAPHLDRATALLLIAVCLIGMLLALIINRPNVDDYYYVPNAVYYAQHPSAAMGFEVHFLYSEPQPIVSAFYSTSGPYEYVQAAAAHILGVNFLTVYYVLGAAVIGSMIPLAIFLLLTDFSTNATSAAVGTLITIAAVLLMGETDLTFGNISLARAFEGKTLLLAVGVPLFACFSLDYFKRPGVMRVLALFCLATTMVGASASAVFVLPALAVVLAISHLLTTADQGHFALTRIPGYVAGMAYVVLYALFALDARRGAPWPGQPREFRLAHGLRRSCVFFLQPESASDARRADRLKRPCPLAAARRAAPPPDSMDRAFGAAVPQSHCGPVPH